MLRCLTRMTAKEEALSLLRAAVASANADFRPGQWEAIQGLLQCRKLFVVQRTGWGKSIIYFVAAKLLRERGAGFALLISPLLSLMRNQIEAARRVGVRAQTINSTNEDDWPNIRQALFNGEVDLLLVSPERTKHRECFRNRFRPGTRVAGAAGGRHGGLEMDIHRTGLQAAPGRERAGFPVRFGR